MRSRDTKDDRAADVSSEGDGSADPIRAAQVAARAAAVGAAVGAVRALATRRAGDADAGDESPANDGEAVPGEADDENDEELSEPEAEQAASEERSRSSLRHSARPREGTKIGQVERALQLAREQLRALNGAEAESISSFGRTREGWRVTLEVVEVRRIPETTDVLASYAIELNDDGDLVTYERVRRYQRSDARNES